MSKSSTAMAWQKNNPDRTKITYDKYRQSEKYHRTRKSYSYQKKFGITLDEYERMSEEQGHVCKICHCPEDVVIHGDVIALSVDHCHDTGKVRGLLCSRCNHFIGLARDSEVLLKSAIKYLKDSK